MQLILEFEELKKLDASLDNRREHTRDFQDPDIIPDFVWLTLYFLIGEQIEL